MDMWLLWREVGHKRDECKVNDDVSSISGESDSEEVVGTSTEETEFAFQSSWTRKDGAHGTQVRRYDEEQSEGEYRQER